VNVVECWFLSREECDPFRESARCNAATEKFIAMVEDRHARNHGMRRRQA
jgi:hypothetical protein